MISGRDSHRLDTPNVADRDREQPFDNITPHSRRRTARADRGGAASVAPAASPDWRAPVAPTTDVSPKTGDRTAGLAGATFTTADLVGQRARAAGLSLDPRRTRRGARAGTRNARFRGRGMEYAESRVYMPGDDARSIDWRVTARTGRVHTKLFDEERDRPILFVVDLGEHMRFGSRRAFKSVVAAEAAALLAWAAVANGDRVGGLTVAGDHVAKSRFTSGRRGALALFRILARAESAARDRYAPTGIRDALPNVRAIARSGTLVILISDFSGHGDPSGSEIARLRRHNDLICVWIHDDLEATPPPPARYPIGDDRRTAILDTRSSEVTRAVTNRFADIERWVTSGCGRAGAVLVRIRCGDDVRSVLRDAFAPQAPRPGAAPS